MKKPTILDSLKRIVGISDPYQDMTISAPEGKASARLKEKIDISAPEGKVAARLKEETAQKSNKQRVNVTGAMQSLESRNYMISKLAEQKSLAAELGVEGKLKEPDVLEGTSLSINKPLRATEAKFNNRSFTLELKTGQVDTIKVKHQGTLIFNEDSFFVDDEYDTIEPFHETDHLNLSKDDRANLLTKVVTPLIEGLSCDNRNLLAAVRHNDTIISEVRANIAEENLVEFDPSFNEVANAEVSLEEFCLKVDALVDNIEKLKTMTPEGTGQSFVYEMEDGTVEHSVPGKPISVESRNTEAGRQTALMLGNIETVVYGHRMVTEAGVDEDDYVILSKYTHESGSEDYGKILATVVKKAEVAIEEKRIELEAYLSSAIRAATAELSTPAQPTP
ncbi:hypothetical protein [Sulfitobacter sp. R18_1]|uniref:hypothetical protein n=1 Tax=Sulfitobacter sp. R18_1 TaxID=2821104 RepID=UPI001ADCA225|nr:hypothetical protein [Sulfitobacter sp. R18_1]MBO9427989.1 hypothetical protein [Sulfitobacter sp. R18_1]